MFSFFRRRRQREPEINLIHIQTFYRWPEGNLPSVITIIREESKIEIVAEPWYKKCETIHEICPICWETDGEHFVKCERCRYRYHTDCVMSMKPQMNSCPMCRFCK